MIRQQGITLIELGGFRLPCHRRVSGCVWRQNAWRIRNPRGVGRWPWPSDCSHQPAEAHSNLGVRLPCLPGGGHPPSPTGGGPPPAGRRGGGPDGGNNRDRLRGGTACSYADNSETMLISIFIVGRLARWKTPYGSMSGALRVRRNEIKRYPTFSPIDPMKVS